MIIRATAKLHNISRLKPIRNESTIEDPLPGEWYASLIPTGRKGGLAIYFVHNPTMIMIIVMGKSLKKAMVEMPDRVRALLERKGFSALIQAFELDTPYEFYATNNRNILANINQLKFSLEYSLAIEEELGPAEIARIEDLYLDYLMGGKIAGTEDYIRPIDQLEKLKASSS
ncbi:MAG: hypothetical protein PHS38_15155 [Bacteroidales bacterium]|jgi:hypothetical protein|nr:hypothetical protein [Bacteroidales bacterium]